MSKWFYYNESGEKIEVTGGQLKGLAKAGIITPGTMVETEGGKTAPAVKVKGLTFLPAVQPETKTVVPPPAAPNPFTAVPPVNANPFTAPASLPVTETALEENNTAVSAPQKALYGYGFSVFLSVLILLSLYRNFGFVGVFFLCAIVFALFVVVFLVVFLRHKSREATEQGHAEAAAATKDVRINKLSPAPRPRTEKAKRGTSNRKYYFHTSPKDTDTISNNDIAPLAQTLHTSFKTFWICAVGGASLHILAILVNVLAAESLDLQTILDGGGATAMFFLRTSMWVITISAILLLPAFGSMLWLFYLLWSVIPAEIARTTPGKAVGFLFIPFYNYYWLFFAIVGLGTDMNKTLRQHGIQHQVDESRGLLACLAVCILPLFVASPDFFNDFGILCALIGCALFVPFFKSVKDGAIALLK